MNKYHKIPLISGLLYLLSLIISVTYSWLSGDHLFDLGISFSAYVGLHRWTSVMYFVFVAVITISMTVYISNNKIPFVKKIIDYIIITGIFGTAFFPFNIFSDHPTAITVDIHNYFGIGLMLATTVSFIFSFISSKIRKHKISAMTSFAFASVFSTLYFLGIPMLFGTFFIWENIFIVLLFIELYMEQYEKPKELTNDKI